MNSHQPPPQKHIVHHLRMPKPVLLGTLRGGAPLLVELDHLRLVVKPTLPSMLREGVLL
jgi:hypothetical protein